MDTLRFKEVLSAFVDSERDLEIKKNSVAIQVGGDVITAELTMRGGALFVTEGGASARAEEWLARRVAFLDLLADRIISSVQVTKTFVTPRGVLLDSLEATPTDSQNPVDDALEAVHSVLDRRPGGTCSVLYLTSDAGEGKSTIINKLAHDQAVRFKNHQADWLLVPIALAGKPFLRFEDVIVASLMNQLRFQRLYFDAFVQLVRMGFIIPALDGFEEVFVETPEGDAVSSLGTLIRQLGGDGTLLIAARKAYFEFKSLEAQARLLDTLPNVDVSFARVRLERWGKEQFKSYCALNGIADSEGLYCAVTSRVRENHPLVTRAVLVRRLVEIAQAHSDFAFVAEIKPESESFFLRFIDQILEREAGEKWIEKFNDPATPLLTIKEHHQLLGYIAEEMWISKKSVLSGEMLDSLAESFCENMCKSPVITRQVRERLKQHALIVTSGTGNREFSFDHDNFREFFLGEQLGHHLVHGAISDIRKIMRIDLLQDWTADTAVGVVNSANIDWTRALEYVQSAARAEGPSSYVRENAGELVIRLLERVGDAALEIDDLVFPADALQGRSLRRVRFRKCYFRSTALVSTQIEDCSFEGCEFERLELERKGTILKCSADTATVVRTLGTTRSGEHVDIYDPEVIRRVLTQAGFVYQTPGVQPLAAPEEVLDDSRMRIFEKAIQTFQRSTQVSTGTFRLRLSLHAKQFFDEILPELKAAGILEEVTHGPGAHDRFKLGVPLATIAAALSDSRGSYERCLTFLRNRRRR